MDNHEALANLVSKALGDDFGAGFVNQEEIKLTDISGYGGSKTFLVTGKGKAKVVLHSRPVDRNDELMKRLGSASLAFYKNSVGPARLVFGSDWYIEKHEGVGTAKNETLEDAKAMGRLLARVHQTPT